MKRRIGERQWIWIGATVFAVAYFILNFNSWRTYSTGGDFGLFMQAMSDSSGWLRNAVEGSHFSDHFSPIYDLCAPLLWLTHSFVPILIVQSVAGALVATGLYEISVRMLSPRLSLAIASVALVYPPLAGVMFGDPYETCFAPAATIWLCLFVLRRQWLGATLAALIALAIKEDQAIFLAWGATLGLFYAARSGDRALRTFSIAVLAVASLTLGSFLVLLRPAVSAGHSWSALHTTLIDVSYGDTMPLSTRVLLRFGYLVEMLVPLAMFPLFAPRVLLFAVPALVEVLAPPNSNVWRMGSHYAGVWIGYVLLAFAFGVAHLHATRPLLAKRLTIAAFALCALNLIVDSPTHWHATVHRYTAHDAQLDTLIAQDLPPARTIGMGDALYGHLWNEPRYQRGLESSPCFALIDTTVTGASLQNTMVDEIQTRKNGTYVPQWTKAGVTLYRRQGCS